MNNEICGIYVTIINTNTVTKKNGIKGLMTSSIFKLATLAPTNRTGPTGGVIVPIDKLKTIIIPKCTGFMPKLKAIGKKIGVNISTAGVGSINVPTINKTMFMISKMTNRLSVAASNASAIIPGIFVNAITQDIIELTPIKKITIAVVLVDSKNILGKSLTLIVRYTNDRKSE